MHSTILSIGSNIEPDVYCAKTIAILNKETRVKGQSKLIETEPWGYKEQPNFLNGAIWLETDLDLSDFTTYLKDLEKRMDRVKTANKAGPRTIDLDIIIWDNVVIDDDYYQKPFVYEPVNEIIVRYSLRIQGAATNQQLVSAQKLKSEDI